MGIYQPDEAINATRAYVQQMMSGESSGHDWWHVDRVTRTALVLAGREGADPVVTELAALLHDVDDWKFSDSEEAGAAAARTWLESLNVPVSVVDEVTEIVRHISFKGGTNTVAMTTLAGKVVQDADRLDALGAIGIARAFAFGGSRGRPMHEPGALPQTYGTLAEVRDGMKRGTTVNHFYEKLLLLAERMNTPSGRELAQARHVYMQAFLDEFYAEWSLGE